MAARLPLFQPHKHFDPALLLVPARHVTDGRAELPESRDEARHLVVRDCARERPGLDDPPAGLEHEDAVALPAPRLSVLFRLAVAASRTGTESRSALGGSCCRTDGFTVS